MVAEQALRLIFGASPLLVVDSAGTGAANFSSAISSIPSTVR